MSEKYVMLDKTPARLKALQDAIDPATFSRIKALGLTSGSCHAMIAAWGRKPQTKCRNHEPRDRKGLSCGLRQIFGPARKSRGRACSAGETNALMSLKLTLACWDYDRTRPLIDGRIQAEDIDFEIKVLRPRETFPRMLEHKEFEVSELSLGSYVTLKGRGTCPFVAVPVALSKIFRHSCIYIRTDAGIRTPQDLRGKRVGTTQLGSTGVVFMNGMLQHEYGVTLEDIHYFIGGLADATRDP